MQVINLPNNWRPRSYQMSVWAYLERGGKRAVEVWHRRAGKDDVSLHWTACAAMERVGSYWHMLPLAVQSRKAIWDAVNPHTGMRRIDEAFPPEICESRRDNDMFIRFKNGSTWQVVGSDNFNSLVGTPPIGLVFSEYSLADPAAWAYLMPILEENGGWAVFIYTARGKNHGHSLLELARKTPGWHAEVLTPKETGVFQSTQLERIREELIAQYGEDYGHAVYMQEYWCSFDAAILGSYYGKEMERAESEGRITDVPHDASYGVVTFWDLGIGDTTAIWFAQQIGAQVRIIDFEEHNGVGLDFYAKLLRGKPYAYTEHIMPHDIAVMELGTGKSRLDTLYNLGIKDVRVLPNLPIDDGIQATRLLLPRCWFDKEKTRRGVDALRSYQREYDEDRKVFKPKPLHNWASHPADAFRYGAVGLQPAEMKRLPIDRDYGRMRRKPRPGWMAA